MEAPSRQDVERQLRLVLGSPEFEAAPKLSELLYYLVTQTLEGHADRLKGYAIGVDVFGRQPDFDQGIDAIVRVQMGRLRKLLAGYYLVGGARDPIRIILLPGRYAPRFELASGEALTDDSLNPPRADQSAAPRNADAPPGGVQPQGFLRLSGKRAWTIALALLALAILGTIGLNFRQIDGKARAPSGATTAMAAQRTSGPVLSISQFRVIGKNELAMQLAEGLQYDLVNQLAKFPGISVLGIEPGTSGTTTKAAKADFILEGAIELDGDTIHITSQLRQSPDGRIIWSDQSTTGNFNRNSLVTTQVALATNVTSKIGQAYGVIPQTMALQFGNREKTQLIGYPCLLNAYSYRRHKTAALHETVRHCLEQTVEAAPKYASAWAMLSLIYGDEERYGFNRRSSESGLRRSLRAAERAVAANANSATAHEYLAVAHFLVGDDDGGARTAAETALTLNPNDAEVLADVGLHLALVDGSEQAQQLIQKAITLSPGHPSWYWGGLAIYALQNDQKDDALKYARLNISDRGPFETYLMAAALRMNGRAQEADAALNELGKTHPITLNNRAHMMQVLRIPPKIETLIFGTPRA